MARIERESQPNLPGRPGFRKVPCLTTTVRLSISTLLRSWLQEGLRACYFIRRHLATLTMKLISLLWLCNACLLVSTRADLTIVQKVEGAGPSGEMTIKIKGEKARMEVSPEATMIMNGKTGEMTTLMNDQKRFMRMSGEKMRAMTQMADQFASNNKQTAEKAKLTPTGKKEIINGYEAEEYTSETPKYKASYWLTTRFPNYSEILKQLKAMQPDWMDLSKQGMPDYRDLPGLPIRTRMTFQGKEFTITISSIKQDPVSDAEFSIPKDFQEMQMPGIPGGNATMPSPSPRS